MKKTKQFLYLALLVTLILGGFNVQAQTSGTTSQQSIPQDLSNVNVSDLSDSQITQMLQRASNAGISDSQLIQRSGTNSSKTDC
jgi:hypothetical protein